MATVLLHTPLNISRSLTKMMEEFCVELQNRHQIEVRIRAQPHRPEEEGLFKSYLDRGAMPDMTVGQVNDLADLPKGYIAQHCRSLLGRFPLKGELADIGFRDPEGYFNPFVVIPFAVFYNPNLLDEERAPRTWSELMDPQWREQILMPDEFRMVSAITRAFIKADFPDAFEDFQRNVVHQGTPMEVVDAVDQQRYPIGITNIAFARVSSQKNTRIIWPEDGLFCMPQVMLWSREAPEPLLEIGDFLMSHPVQEYLALQGFVPASPDVPVAPIVAEGAHSLRWKGWPAYLAAVRERNA